MNQNSINNSQGKDEDPLICEECMKCFCSRSKLNRHIREQHTQKGTLFCCDSCEKTFKRKEHLKRHVKGVHQGMKLTCQLCVSSFIENYKLKNHLLEKHQAFLCERCGSLVKSSSIGEHFCSEEYVIEKDTYTCAFCPKKYKRKAYLVKHL